MARRTVLWITILTTVISSGLFFWALLNAWFGPPTGVALEFCEAYRPGIIKQPANTWSNLGFIIAGLWIAWELSKGVYRTNNSLTRSTFYATFYSCLVVLLGPGSMAMHATGTEVGGFFDMLSMYLIAGFVTAYAMQRFFKWQPVHFTVVFCLVLVTCLWADRQHDIHFLFGFFGVTAFAFYIGITILVESLNIYIRKLEHQSHWAYYSFGALIAAFVIWIPSHDDGFLCDPQSLLQGHAVWHLLNAVSLYCLFRYYVSEHYGE